MADLTVSRIERARTAVEAATPGAGESGRRDRQPRPRPRRIPVVIAEALPGLELEECEMVYDYDAGGAIQGVTVRDTLTRRPLARFDLASLTRLVAESGQRGVLLERRG